MRKQILILLALVILCAPAYAQEKNMLMMFSPKLREFLGTHRQAFQVFSNTISECFSNRVLQVYYFYTDDEFTTRAYHYYPSELVVGVAIRENQEPLDEFISVIYEARNSLNKKLFESIFEEVRSGKISKNEFADKVNRGEFEASLWTKNRLAEMKFNRREANKSFFYNRLIKTPDNIENYLSYIKKVSPQRAAEIEKKLEYDYDSLRQEANSTAP